MKTRIYIGPMTKAVVDGAIEHNKRTDDNVGLIASRRQVDMNHGYSNNWDTFDFVWYVKDRDIDIPVCRDHGGILQGNEPDYGMKSMLVDGEAGMDIIHIDPWKTKHFNYSVEYTLNAIQTLMEYSDTVQFEIGTEQSIYSYDAVELEDFLHKASNRLGENFKRITYVVIQSGTSLQSGKNTGEYNEDKLKDMIEVCKKFNVMSKEHNGDYIGAELLKHKLSLGLDAINIAPELAGIENRILFEKMDTNQRTQWLTLVLNDGQWTKWFPAEYEPKDNMEEVLSICGHYVLSYKDFKDIFDLSSVEDEVIEGVCDFLKERSL